MKIRVNSKKPLLIDGRLYPQGEHILLDKIAHTTSFKALFKSNAIAVLPKSDSEVQIQKGKDALAAKSAQLTRKG
jgi:hypothetical protein